MVFLNIVDYNGAEGVNVIPDPIGCTFCSGGALFQAITLFGTPNNGVFQVIPPFPGSGDRVLITSENGIGTSIVTFSGGNYVKTFFDNIPGADFEGSSFVDCAVPTPTATSTPTATATATATSTPTATATATLTRYSYSNSNGNSNTYTDSHAYGDTDYMRFCFCYR